MPPTNGWLGQEDLKIIKVTREVKYFSVSEFELDNISSKNRTYDILVLLLAIIGSGLFSFMISKPNWSKEVQFWFLAAGFAIAFCFAAYFLKSKSGLLAKIKKSNHEPIKISNQPNRLDNTQPESRQAFYDSFRSTIRKAGFPYYESGYEDQFLISTKNGNKIIIQAYYFSNEIGNSMPSEPIEQYSKLAQSEKRPLYIVTNAQKLTQRAQTVLDYHNLTYKNVPISITFASTIDAMLSKFRNINEAAGPGWKGPFAD
jgi:hypothetical protein